LPTNYSIPFLENSKSLVFPQFCGVCACLPPTSTLQDTGCVGLGPKKCTMNPTALGIYPGDHRTRVHTHAQIHPDTGHGTGTSASTSKFALLGCLSSAFSPASFVCANYCGSRIMNSRSFLQAAIGQSPANLQSSPGCWVSQLRKDLWRMLGIGGLLRRNRQLYPFPSSRVFPHKITHPAELLCFILARCPAPIIAFIAPQARVVSSPSRSLQA
jgi:hypothetical protein